MSTDFATAFLPSFRPFPSSLDARLVMLPSWLDADLGAWPEDSRLLADPRSDPASEPKPSEYPELVKSESAFEIPEARLCSAADPDPDHMSSYEASSTLSACFSTSPTLVKCWPVVAFHSAREWIPHDQTRLAPGT